MVTVLIYANDSEQPSFFFNPDPGVKLLEIKYLGGMSHFIEVYTLYADGRLAVQQTDHSGASVYSTSELSLSFDEITRLLEEIVKSGLMESGTEKLKTKMKEAGHRLYAASDSGSMFLTVNLEGYRASGKEKVEQISVNISLKDPIGAARMYPNLPEVQCLAGLTRDMLRYKRMARDYDENKEHEKK